MLLPSCRLVLLKDHASSQDSVLEQVILARGCELRLVVLGFFVSWVFGFFWVDTRKRICELVGQVNDAFVFF